MLIIAAIVAAAGVVGWCLSRRYAMRTLIYSYCGLCCLGITAVMLWHLNTLVSVQNIDPAIDVAGVCLRVIFVFGVFFALVASLLIGGRGEVKTVGDEKPVWNGGESK
jgi:hypothetical protein